MFRISCIVDDKKLSKALYGLNGLARNLEVQPVANAVANGKGGIKQLSEGTAAARIWALLVKAPGKYSREDLDKLMVKHGSSPGHVVNIIRQLVEQGRMKRLARGSYEVPKGAK